MQHRLLAALNRQPVDRTPVWVMRQAGRYLPEYRKLRADKGSFMALCTTPELACEVTLQPLKRFNLDAAILFSDILTIPDAMGLGLHFIENEGPKFSRAVDSYDAVQSLPQVDCEQHLSYVSDAVSLICEKLAGKTPLIGFSGSPWTLAVYMIEGGASKDFKMAKSMLYREQETLHLLLEKLTTVIIDYLSMQIRAGVDVVQLFDTWGGLLSTTAFKEFSLQYLKKIVTAIKAKFPLVPIIIFTKNGNAWLADIATSGCDCIGVDWQIDLATARQMTGNKVAIQGNMDPAVLMGSKERIREEVRRILENYGQENGHVFNLGHGITPDIDPDNVQALIEAVEEFSRR